MSTREPSRVPADPFVGLLGKVGTGPSHRPLVHEVLIVSATQARDAGVTRKMWLASLRGHVHGPFFRAALHVAPLIWSRFLEEDDDQDD